jgi:glycosyltransferase involved in cell wall biosynthesis
MPNPASSMQPDVTVVIPAYKAERTIERTVRSALGQPAITVSVIVVVDDLSRVTQQVVTSIGGSNLSLLVNETNKGAQFTRNRGLSQTLSEFVMFLDSDDYLTGNVLSGLVSRMHETGADIAFGPFILSDESINRCERTVSLFRSSPDAFRRWLTQGGYVPPCSVLWRTDFIRRIGGWDEALTRNQDGELVLRGLLLGGKICTTSIGAGVYEQHPSEHRITRSRSNFSSLIVAADKLLSIESEIVAADEKKFLIAQHLYDIAASAYRRGDIEFGAIALTRSRELGFRGHRGSSIAKLGSRIFGVRRYQTLANKLKTYDS